MLWRHKLFYEKGYDDALGDPSATPELLTPTTIYAPLVKHLLGYVAQASEKDLIENEVIKKSHVPGLRVGKIGLEKTYENQLIGSNGIQRYEVNAYGKRINQIDFVEGKKGTNIKLTVDTEIQAQCNDLLKDKAGSICVIDERSLKKSKKHHARASGEGGREAASIVKMIEFCRVGAQQQ